MTHKLIAGFIAACALLGACSSSDDEASTCEALQGLGTSIQDLGNLDIVSTGTDGLNEALDEVETSWQAVQDDAGDQFSDQIDSFNSALEGVDDAFSSIPESDSLADSATEVSTSIDGLATAWDSLATAAESELGDCDLSTDS